MYRRTRPVCACTISKGNVRRAIDSYVGRCRVYRAPPTIGFGGMRPLTIDGCVDSYIGFIGFNSFFRSECAAVQHDRGRRSEITPRREKNTAGSGVTLRTSDRSVGGRRLWQSSCMSEECAICFDSIPADDQIPLPCKCRVPYCLHCWDRSLAAAFNDTGAARCPTCRSPVRVDFDHEAAGGRGRLVFTSDNGEARPSEESRAQVVNRLAEQSAPLMTRLLRTYGEAHPSLRVLARDPAAHLASKPVRELKALLTLLGDDPAMCFEKADLIDRLQRAARSDPQLAAFCVAAEDAQEQEQQREPKAANEEQEGAAGPAMDIGDAGTSGSGDVCPAGSSSASTAEASSAKPGEVGVPSPLHLRCVCGGMLERMNGMERARMLYCKEFPQLEQHQIQQLLQLQLADGQVCVVCDLCDKSL